MSKSASQRCSRHLSPRLLRKSAVQSPPPGSDGAGNSRPLRNILRGKLSGLLSGKFGIVALDPGLRVLRESEAIRAFNDRVVEVNPHGDSVQSEAAEQMRPERGVAPPADIVGNSCRSIICGDGVAQCRGAQLNVVVQDGVKEATSERKNR